MNDNCQGYFSMESLLSSCNKPFHISQFNGYTHNVPSNQYRGYEITTQQTTAT